MQGFGSWIYFKNLPLDLGGSKYTFEAIGAHFMGLESNAPETLNLINCTEAIIQVRRNLCGFMPSTIELKTQLKEISFHILVTLKFQNLLPLVFF